MHDFAAIVRGREAEIRLAIRVTVAAAGAYAVARLVALPQGYWAVITAILIMQTSLGGSLKAAIDRLGGTLAGAVYGAVVSIFIPHSTFATLTAAIAVATGPMAMLAAINSSFKIAPVTALIVLLPTPGNAAPPLLYALDLEIGVGNIIGIVVAMFVLPARAHALLIHAAARVVLLNAELMKALIEGLATGEGRPGLPAIHARIRAALKQMETAADEASRERRSHLTDMPDPEPLVRTLYRVRHDLVMIGRAAAKPLPKPIATTLLPRLFVLRDATVDLLSGLADALEAQSQLLRAKTWISISRLLRLPWMKLWNGRRQAKRWAGWLCCASPSSSSLRTCVILAAGPMRWPGIAAAGPPPELPPGALVAIASK